MIRYLPNFITCLNLSVGVLGIINVFKGDYTNTLLFVFLAAFFDLLDGLLARALNAKSAIGKELDSLADLVSFGVLPALYLFSYSAGKSEIEWLPYVCILIVVFSALRLARFNSSEENNSSFEGLPTPANAILITTFGQLDSSIHEWPYAAVLLTIVSCVLLVSKIEMLSLKISNPSFKKNWPHIILVILILTVSIVFKISALPYIIPIYILVSVVNNLRHMSSKN